MKKLILLLFLPIWLHASNEGDCCPICCHDRPALLSLGAGIWDVLNDKHRATQYQVEYKWSACWHGVQPFTSFFFTDKGALYLCFGACYDIFLHKRIVLTPSFAPGIYVRNGGKNLGYPLEFRSSIALSYQFENGNRFGVQFYHISNASLGSQNPGAECLIFSYSIAFW